MATEQLKVEMALTNGLTVTAPLRNLAICRNDGPVLPEKTVVTRLAVVGMSGSGKTQTARKLAEAIMDRGQHIGVFDPTGVWWGLRSSADGLRPGYPIVVFGGEHADAPLDVNGGATMATLFVEKRFNAIFDLSDWEDPEVRFFTTAFLKHLKRINRTPVHIFLDEFDIICPQTKGAHTETSRAACNAVVRRGRVKGIGCTMITQNPQDADKSVLNMADTVIAMRTQGSPPVDALRKWMGRGLDAEKLAELVTTLGELKTGSGWMWSPQNGLLLVVEFLLCKTFDSSKTPEMGETIEPPKVLAAVDIARLGKEIAASVERVKAGSPEFLNSEWRSSKRS